MILNSYVPTPVLLDLFSKVVIFTSFDEVIKYGGSKAGVYVMTTLDDLPLYVGRTSNLRNRFSLHKHSGIKTHRFASQVSLIYFFVCKDQGLSVDRLDSYESCLIHYFQPAFNYHKTNYKSLYVDLKKACKTESVVSASARLTGYWRFKSLKKIFDSESRIRGEA